ncbi:MAG: UDP-N-acetylmuramate:L-alanyl-gamma-D-glutamyl-meso-diaminopimelate ligase [Burkholderiaceae bacterium]|nr:UDP-N-acetylmuramate:L-alanyl-gamma-D-glutamyl-meso-diaminopimelate ligase [Burkholderiaceae bacterium]MDH5207266.1 UDP-N-acetylmuramate:L-alanyl-gamma-D-glutamyl-meso-diaminopimelate ligase [Burkholderiaceae bacterium]
MHIHILGICGTFMGGLAQLARASGHRVSGCDANVYPPMSDQLAEAGIAAIEGFGTDQLALGADLYVVGNVVTRGNPLMEAILERQLPFVSGPQWLADNVLRGRHVLAVAGTHGKTTTTAMLAWILASAGLKPGYLVGGVPQDFGRSAASGDGRTFVIEADEYDTAFFDKRSKFVHYLPRTAVLNNLEFDHADIFQDLAAIETQFHHFVRTLARPARVVVNAGEPALARVLARGCWSEKVSFGDGGEWQVGRDAPYRVTRGGQPVGELEIAMPGQHNRLNALAAIVAAEHVGVEPTAALEALRRFGGIKRRLEERGTEDGVTVIDDFAHHPTAIRETIAALRARRGAARIVAILEPRSNTMKLGAMKTALADSLAGADRVFCYAGGVSWNVAEAMASLGDRAAVTASLAELADAAVADARAGDQLLVMSNGGFGGIHTMLLDRLRDRARRAA